MSGLEIRTKLMPGERVLWEGSPAQGILFTSRDALLIPFSTVWLSFTLFWLWTAISNGAPVFFRLWGTMFLAIGLFIFAGRFAVDAWLRKRTVYAVTDQRVLIVRKGPFASFTSIGLDRLPEINLIGDGGARGDIRFGPTASLSGDRAMSAWVPSLDQTPQFLGIAAPSSVFDVLMQASRTMRTRTNAESS
ncbi:PH domain-containing protein [Ensifer sp. ENS06]|uniref:hypothetical protein n=1 Tax=unclassified Ensifer TaxID=2633371 RepID=UPI0007C80B3C|nr:MULTISPECIES: hypothetical protein [unclassified Ensifer]MBD9624792.1 PH domain-containing protein [Ensifer sp. ENS06]